MMLGGRFDVGVELPRGLPSSLEADIRVVEATLSDDDRTHKRWTLTWLEGRAVVTLDGGPTLRA